jgi:hypothetical protein
MMPVWEVIFFLELFIGQTPAVIGFGTKSREIPVDMRSPFH